LGQLFKDPACLPPHLSSQLPDSLLLLRKVIKQQQRKMLWTQERMEQQTKQPRVAFYVTLVGELSQHGQRKKWMET